jgi:hypothetical protein
MKHCKPLSEADRGYIAALLDWYGHVEAGPEFRVSVLHWNNYLSLYLRLATGMGRGQNYEWECAGRRAVSLLVQVLPLMKNPAKILRARALLEACGSRRLAA